ncbi:probable G-protein coupled receptor No18 [Battus philenor]|uniref:probable G-protein coupled receptor No18 n=1 Tax=Battus philenor TaxID=42288 RepID=UPI0035CF7B37
MFVITVTTVVANLVVIIALWRVKRAPVHYPMTSLVIADLLLGVTVMPIAMGREMFVFQLNVYLCSFWRTMDVLCCTASILSLCALGWERWSAITAPLSLHRRVRIAKRLAWSVWPIATLVAFPTVIIPSPYHHHPLKLVKACTINTNIRYVFFSVVFSFFVPAAVMLVLYARIIHALAAAPPIRAHRGRTPVNDPQPTEPVPSGSQATTSAAVQAVPAQASESLQAGPSSVVATATQGASSVALQSAASLGVATATSQVLKIDADVTPHCVSHVESAACLSIEAATASSPPVAEVPSRSASMRIQEDVLTQDTHSLCDCVWGWVFRCCTWLGYMNSALNPMVYAIASHSVRRALRHSFASTIQNSEIPMTSIAKR